ncbi:MAG: NUDIX hydrolase [Chloroflexota bacterium]
MKSPQPAISSAGPRIRTFATFPAAVQAILINRNEEILLLSSPTRKQGWQLVSGALEAGETVSDGTLREVYEELGADVQVRPIGTVHAETFQFDENIPFMLSVYTLFAYEGGKILPTDDMAGSEAHWFSLTDLDQPSLKFHATAKPWMLKRAIDLFRLWGSDPIPPLKPFRKR